MRPLLSLFFKICCLLGLYNKFLCNAGHCTSHFWLLSSAQNIPPQSCALKIYRWILFLFISNNVTQFLTLVLKQPWVEPSRFWNVFFISELCIQFLEAAFCTKYFPAEFSGLSTFPRLVLPLAGLWNMNWCRKNESRGNWKMKGASSKYELQLHEC